MLFTDAEIVELQNVKDYKRTNRCWQNRHLSRKVIKLGKLELGISVNLSISGPSLEMSPPKIFWFFSRRYYITKELIKCRTKIIEQLLNKESNISPDDLVKSSIGKSQKWLEYHVDKLSKLRVVKDACLEYIEEPKNKLLLGKQNHSKVADDQLTEVFWNVREKIEEIFRLTEVELKRKKVYDVNLDYLEGVGYEEFATKVLEITLNHIRTGNLFDPNPNEKEDA